MPPARKDSTEADGPSTSRAFSPVLVPPVKRARVSTGGVPPAASRRQSTGTTRQARLDEFIDEKELQEGLLVAATQTADEIMKEEEEEGKEKIEIDNEVISATARIVWDALAEDWATDLLAFSRHANRETIKEEDVKLLMRRNPNLLAEIMAECEEEEDGEGGMNSTMGGIKRRSTGGSVFNRCGETIDETEMFDTMTTPMGATSMTSVVPETPQGIVPLAHSTPMSGHRHVLRAAPSFPVPSPIREEAEGEGEKSGGRRTNRSIMNDLSATMRAGGGEMEEERHSPIVIDLRHPREQEDEERRMRMGEDGDGDLYPIVVSPLNQQPGPSKKRDDYGRADSPELFGHSDDGGGKKDEYDSFEDDNVIDEGHEEVGKAGEASHRMSESAALREMLDEDEEGKESATKKDEHDSFDDDSIQFVEVTKVPTPAPVGDAPSTSAAATTVQQTAAVAARAAPAKSATSLRSSQDSFYLDEIISSDPPQPVHVPPVRASPKYCTAVVQGQQPPAVPTVTTAPTPAQSVRAADYDSFDDDDDFVTSPRSRSKENNLSTTKSGGPSPASSSTANRWSTVTVEEVVSPPAAPQKNRASSRGFCEEDFFLLSAHSTAPTKPSPNNRPSPTVPSRPSPTVPTKPSPPVSTKPALSASKQSSAAASSMQRFSFFDNSPAVKTPVVSTPVVQRGDSDFLDSSSRQTTSAMRTPRGRGGARGGRGFPRKVDPNSKVNRMIREQSTPVRLSPRPPSRISEVVGSFEDDDFDASAFDD